MTTSKRRTKTSGHSYVQHWTRQEQIDNAFLDETLAEMSPALGADEEPSEKARRLKA